MDNGNNNLNIGCGLQDTMSQEVNPLLLPLMIPIMLTSSFMSVITNSLTSLQQNSFTGMSGMLLPMPGMNNTLDAFKPMSGAGKNSLVNVSYDEKGNITTIHERTW